MKGGTLVRDLLQCGAMLVLGAGLLPAAAAAQDIEAFSKIVGGWPVQQGSYPWQVSLVKAEVEDNVQAHFCGGALISAGWVITAAHCVTAREGGTIEAGDFAVLTRTARLSAGGERVAVDEVIVHPRFDPDSMDADIALLRLSDAGARTMARAAPTEAPVPARRSWEAPGTQALVIGWGTTESYAPRRNRPEISDQLLQAELRIVDMEACAQSIHAKLPRAAVGDEQICAGYPEGGRDSCQGDSGGPLVVAYPDPARQGDHLLVGIVSYGWGCAQPDAYGVYTRVSAFVPWIRETLGQ